MQLKKFGWKPDKPDARDFKFSAEILLPIQSVSLWGKYRSSLSYDQGDLGSCTANALAYLVQFDLLNKFVKNPGLSFRPSRLFNYYYERLIEGTVNEDSGAELRDGIKALATYGIPSESVWPYDISKFTQSPSPDAIQQALNFKGLAYQRLDNTNKAQLVTCLLQGYPMAFGFTVYESFMSDQVASTGIVPMPTPGEQIEGGHAVVIEGYSLPKDAFVCRNSWGINWGMCGSFVIPAAYITNSDLCTDFWKLSMVL